MPVPLDKLTRIIAWVMDDVEFIAVTASVSEFFFIDPANTFSEISDVGGGIVCEPSDRFRNDGDATNWLKRLSFSFNNGAGSSLQAYSQSEAIEENVWGEVAVGTLSTSDAAQITSSYPNMVPTSESFPDWMYLALDAGDQDFWTEYSPQEGTNIIDSRGNVVISPLLGLPFKSGVNTQKLLKATRYDTGPLCLRQIDEIADVGLLGGALGARETAHTITISWSALSVTFDDSEWLPIGYAVSPEHNPSAIQIICQPAGAA